MLTSTSGAVCGSISCPRTLWHADQGNRTSALPITRRWLYPWAAAAHLLNFSELQHFIQTPSGFLLAENDTWTVHFSCTYTVSNNGAISTLVNIFWGQDKFWETTRTPPVGTGPDRLDLNPQLQFKDPETEPRRMSGDRTKMDGGETLGEQ